LRQRVVDECLVPYLHDGCDAWELGADGRYTRAADASQGDGRHSAQRALAQRYAQSSVQVLSLAPAADQATPRG